MNTRIAVLSLFLALRCAAGFAQTATASITTGTHVLTLPTAAYIKSNSPAKALLDCLYGHNRTGQKRPLHRGLDTHDANCFTGRGNQALAIVH